MRKIKKCANCDNMTSRRWCVACGRQSQKRRQPLTEEQKKNYTPNGGAFKKGQSPWNKGIEYTQISGENHPNWKGAEVGYLALHSWVARKLGKPNLCEDCGTTGAKKFEWANISGQYKRDLSDWVRLCTKCHHKFDNIAQRGWVTKKTRIA